jgi:methylthioribose-1-phosphate isomerase
MGSTLYPVIWKNDRVVLIDQTRIPEAFETVEVTSSDGMATAIKTMIVRGAPAIGVAAAFGLCLGGSEIHATDRATFLSELEVIAQKLRQTRPTAVNLFWAIDRMMKTVTAATGDVAALRSVLLTTAQKISDDDVATCMAIGDHGVSALPATPAKIRLLTHCNAGALATAGYGTALGVVRSAWRDGRLERVYAD